MPIVFSTADLCLRLCFPLCLRLFSTAVGVLASASIGCCFGLNQHVGLRWIDGATVGLQPAKLGLARIGNECVNECHWAPARCGSLLSLASTAERWLSAAHVPSQHTSYRCWYDVTATIDRAYRRPRLKGLSPTTTKGPIANNRSGPIANTTKGLKAKKVGWRAAKHKATRRFVRLG